MHFTESSTAPLPPPLEHAHHQPPPHIKAFHKLAQKTPEDADILDFSTGAVSDHHKSRLKQHATISGTTAAEVFARFSGEQHTTDPVVDIPIYTHNSVPGTSQPCGLVYNSTNSNNPGLLIVPNLLPIATQQHLLATLLTGALSETETHKTNLHTFYSIPSPLPWFSEPPTTTLQPLTDIHKPLTLSQALTKKLRWMTLGGQYDWTAKRYPDSLPPPFPTDVAGLVHGLFPDVTAQAAIVNLYSPGDMLAPHRDIAESVGKGLVSISVGCSGVFVIGCDEKEEVLAVRLNSGDAVVMGGESRWAWHSVPRVERGTCPEELAGWGAGQEQWKDWMRGKRVNVNVRQMWD
jgi:alkylated DNA repair protein alkB family protein 1